MSSVYYGQHFKRGWWFNFRRNSVITILILSIIMHFSKTESTAPGAKKICGKCLFNINLSLFTVFLHRTYNTRFLDTGCHNYMISRQQQSFLHVSIINYEVINYTTLMWALLIPENARIVWVEYKWNTLSSSMNYYNTVNDSIKYNTAVILIQY